MPLTVGEVETLIIIERTAASISATSTLILLATFCSIKAFRTLSNTLIFYASFANLFANVAALIGGSALDNQNGPLCQFQAFLLEMFMQSDPLWSCAMAVNVYLVFFRRYDPIRLRRLHWVYGVLCYGLPFIPAMFCLFYKDKKRGKMYGDATLWCWIDNRWAVVRIYSYYLPIWISILVALGIYFRVGFEIYRVRAQIRALENSSSDYTSNNYNSGTFNSGTFNSGTFNSGTFNSGTFNSTTLTSGTLTSISDNKNEPQTPGRFDESRTIDEEAPQGGIWRSKSAESSGMNYNTRAGRFGSQIKDEGNGMSLNLPSPISHPSYNSFHPTSPLDPSYPHLQERDTPSNSPQRTTMDKVKWAYTKCALLFAISILITWVPASINRVHGLVEREKPSFTLNVMSALVLPLQGFWNTVIFFTTSFSVTKRVIRKWMGKNGKGTGKDGVRHGSKEREEGAGAHERSGIGEAKGKEKEREREGDVERESSGRISDRTLAEEVV